MTGAAEDDPIAVKPGYEDCVQNLPGRWLRHALGKIILNKFTPKDPKLQS